MQGTVIVNNTESNLEYLSKEIKYTLSKVHECDKKISEFYHDLETRKFNACEGWFLAKELQDLLQERRAWKQRNLEAYESFNDLGGEKKLKYLKSRRKNRVKKFMNFNSWYDNFSPEARAILEGTSK